MNKIKLKGYIKDIKPSHIIGDIEYSQANLIVNRNNSDKQDIIPIKFKKFCNHYKELDFVELIGNIRSYSHKVSEDKNKVDIYVFTYQDIPETADENSDIKNKVELDGRICKLDELRTTKTGKHNVHFILANNLISKESCKKLNSYIPCIAWGKTAKEIAELSVNTRIQIQGELHSREYTKTLANGDVEIRVCHELLITDFCKI